MANELKPVKVTVFFPSDVDVSIDRASWYLENAIRGHWMSFAHDNDPIRGMARASVAVHPLDTDTRPAAPVEGLNLNIDKEWLEKKAAQEGYLEVGVGRRSSISNPTPQEITELERIAFEALPQWAQDELTRLRAATAAPVEGLETVGYAYGPELRELSENTFVPLTLSPKYQNIAHQYEAVVTRSQAEAIIAAKVEQERLRFEGELDKWMKIIGAGITGYQPEAYALMDLACQELVKLRTDNAALTARVKELELIRDSHSRDTLQALQGQQALETQLAAATGQHPYIELVLVRTASETPVPSHGGPAVYVTWELSLNGVVIESSHERYHWSDREKAGLKAPSHMQKLLVDLQAAIDSPPTQQGMVDEQE